MSDQPAGHYYAEGDPPDTVRYWDGTQWVGDPIPAPPSASPPPPSGSPVTAAGSDSDRFAGLGVRIGASLIDAIVAIVAVLIIVVFVFTASTNDRFGSSASRSDGLIVGLLFYLVFLWMVVQFGGTPGKLMLGLRITEEDGQTPVGWRGAFMRSLPGLLGNIPVVGFVITLGAAIASLVMVANDPERRSAYDRIGSTRVVYRKFLD